MALGRLTALELRCLRWRGSGHSSGSTPAKIANATQTVAAGTTSASYTIPLSWLDAIPSATSGSASVTLETLDAGGNSLGSASYGFTVTVPSSVVPTISSITASPVNSNSVIADWCIYVYGKSQAKLAISGAAGAYGSTIKSYSITTDPAIGSTSASSLTTSTIYKTGTITVTAKVTDSRGRSATKSTTFSVYSYGNPNFSSIESYRCNSAGTQDDVSGTYARLKVTFGVSALNGSNKATCTVKLAQVGGSYSTSATLTSGTAIILGGNLAIDAVYEATLALPASMVDLPLPVPTTIRPSRYRRRPVSLSTHPYKLHSTKHCHGISSMRS